MTTTIYLIQHAETAWSVAGLHMGSRAIELNEKGRHDACELAIYLRDIHFAYVLTSPFGRAQQTCALAGLGHEAVLEPALSEWNYGEYEGLSTKQILNHHPAWNIYCDGCFGGEMPIQVAERVDRLIARLLNLGGNIALFSHQHISRVIAARWLGLSPLAAQHFALNAASISILSFEQHTPHLPVISLWNASFHLAFDVEPLRMLGDWENEGGKP